MQKYLMTIALGPVQEFIAAARRTADLTAGSKLLVELARHLATHLVQHHHADLIFPASTKTDAPNKLLFTVSGTPHKIAADAKEQAHHYLREQWDECISQLSSEIQQSIDTELVNWQLKNFLEFYAAWVPLNGNYQSARRRLEQLLAGRKALRDFTQPPANPKRPKSPLDPAMDSVFKPNGYEVPIAAQTHPKLRLKPRETLDAISLIKRIKGGSGVPSTREMGFRSVEKKLCEEALGAYRALQKYQNDFAFDDLSDLFYQERFEEIVHERGQNNKGYPPLSDEEKEKICKYATQLRNALKDMKVPLEALSYYAILVADGDRMGAALNEHNTENEHRAFSNQLDQFAEGVSTIIEDHSGHLVYCGGDDVLALLPTNYALACAKKLHDTFVSCMHPVMPSGMQPSLSAGIAIVHVMDNLQVALGWAREAEQYAKQTRNAIAVARYPRSGGMKRARTQWGDFESWNYWINAFRKGLADALPYELRLLAQEYQNLAIPADILHKEATRVLNRKEKPKDLEVAIPDTVQSVDDLRALTELMLIARFLSIYPEV